MLWLAPAWTGAPLLPPCPCGLRTLELRGVQLGGYPPGLPHLVTGAGGGLWQPHQGPSQDYPDALPTEPTKDDERDDRELAQNKFSRREERGEKDCSTIGRINSSQ